eukprot:14149035-Heterocapsa_arctica.AAC.1
MKNYVENGHTFNFEDWQICQQCKAKGLAMNKCECLIYYVKMRDSAEGDELPRQIIRMSPLDVEIAV